MSRFFFGIRKNSVFFVAVALLAAACGSEGGDARPVEKDPATPDAGDVDADLGDAPDGSFGYPPLPAECDGPPQQLVRWTDHTWVARLRATEESVYAALKGSPEGLFRIPVTGGQPASLLEKGQAPPDDFWIEEDSIVLAIAGSPYRLPLTGGIPTLLEGHTPEQDPEALCYARDASHLYWMTDMGRGLRRVALAGGEVEALIDLPPTETSIACPIGVDDTHLVVGKINSLIRIPKTGGEQEPLFEAITVELLSTSPPWVVKTMSNEIPGVSSAIVQLGDAKGDEPTVLLGEMGTLPIGSMARHDGQVFVLGQSDFSVPDDLRSIPRLRLWATDGGAPAEPVGCIAPPFEPMLQGGGEEELVYGMAANSSAVYVVATPPSSGHVRIAEVKR